MKRVNPSKHSRPKQMSRRELFEAAPEVVSGLAALSSLFAMLPARSASGAEICNLGSQKSNVAHRKYLINVECGGGIDHHYLGNGIEPSQFTGIANRYDKYSQAAGRLIGNVPHPSAPAHYLGAALQIADHGDLRFADIAKDLFVVKGLQPEGQHQLGNRIIANGGSSVYNAGYCSLVAAACGAEKEKAFQHVALAQLGYNQVGMLKGSAVPTMVQNMTTFLASVKDVSADKAAVNRKEFVRLMIKELAGDVAAKTLAKCESLKLYANFGSSFDQVAAVREQPILSSDPNVQWDEIWNWWNAYFQQQAANHPMCKLNIIDGNGNGQGNQYFRENQAQMTFYGAMTEFLIRRDLSSVINMQYNSGDRHGVDRAKGGYVAEGMLQAAYGSLYLGLMYRLKKISIGGGKTLLDQTLMATVSEFDRTAQDDGLGGSDHAGYHSILMAGSGYRGVVGGQGMKSGPYAGYTDAFGSTGQLGCLTMKSDGTPDPSGKGISLQVSAVLPMVVKMMGTSLPAQQITINSQAVDRLAFIRGLKAA